MRLDKLRERMESEGLPALLVSDVANVQWLTGFTGSFGMVLATASDAVFITDSRYTIQASEQVVGAEVVTFGSPKTAADTLAEQAKRLGLERLGFETSTPYSTWEQWSRALAPIELVPTTNLLDSLRIVKSDDEVRKIREACKLADACFQHVLRMIQPGAVEYDLGLEIEFFFRRHKAGIAFEPIVVSGANSARPHGRPSEKRLEPGDFLTLDFGASVEGYCSDITRTVVVGRATPRHRTIYEQVLKAQVAAIDALRPGANGKEVDALARTILDEENLSQYFGHGLGHGLGRAVHDVGRLSSNTDQPIEPGQVWTVEPGVYIEGFGGVRIEDDVLVTEGAPEVLTAAPKTLMELE